MDIHLADGTSFDIFRQVEVNVPVVFTTAYDQYMVNAFQHHSIDYILKPTKKEAIEKSLEKYHRWYDSKTDVSKYATLLQWNTALHKVYKERFLVQVGKKLIPINTKDIAYFYADSKLVMVAMNNDRHYIINHTLGELEQLLNPTEFYRLNRKSIINLNSIKSLEMGKNYKWRCQVAPTPSFDMPIPTDKLSEFKEWVSG